VIKPASNNFSNGEFVDSSKAIKDGKVTDGQYIKHLKCQET
jgi:hypothetical protein